MVLDDGVADGAVAVAQDVDNHSYYAVCVWWRCARNDYGRVVASCEGDAVPFERQSPFAEGAVDKGVAVVSDEEV